jgi:peptidoglycan hydrolase-like protein with peptidoglycan-binding domain
MHYEIVASRTELAAGIDWSTVRREPPDPARPATWPVLEQGDEGPSVEELQRRLLAAGAELETDGVLEIDGDLEIDGVLGERTTAVLRRFQSTRGLDVDGVCGLQTWTALLTGQPEVEPGDSPVKGGSRAPDSHPSTRAKLQRGSEGHEVVDLQRRLLALGFDIGHHEDDGVFGPRTEAAVHGYQESRSLDIDGIVGLRTWTALLRAT